MKTTQILTAFGLIFLLSCNEKSGTSSYPENNPLFTEFNQPVDFTAVKADHINEAVEYIQGYTNDRINDIIATTEPNYDNLILSFDDLFNEMYKVTLSGYLLGNTSEDSLIRNTALAKSVEMQKFSQGIFQNKDLYNKLVDYNQTNEAKSLEGHKRKALRDLLYSFESNGMKLNDADLEKLKQIKEDIVDISTQFSQNITTYEDFLIINEEQSKGLPEAYKKQRKTDNGNYKIDLSYPSLTPFLKFNPSEKLRKELLLKFANRASDKNLEVLDKLLEKRNEMARLLGYKSYAEHNLVNRMAEKPENVWQFEKDLVNRVKKKAQIDYDQLMNLKKKDNTSEKITDKINRWDLSYYTEQLKRTKYDFDTEEVKKYFSMETSLKGLFDITQNLFGLEYKEVESPKVWHRDVKMYEVYKSDNLIGRFYLDLYPRSNKYTHMACFPMRPGKKTDQGYQLPIASLVCNFPEPSEDQPSLLSHGQVETLFHEFGHVLHNILYNSDLASQSILSVKRDFVEAPSQIFENWTWEYDALKLFAKHYETGEVLPKALYDKMLAAKNVNSGLSAQTQIFLGMYDFTLHDKYSDNGDFNTDQVAFELSREVMTVPRAIEGTHFQAAFGHLNGYGASYYGYLWSLVYAQDMYSVFEENGPMDRESGERYANIILANGSSKEEIDLVREFLKREPNNEAFIRSLGL